MATATARKGKQTTPAKVDLSHLIPDQVFADEYVARKIEGVWDVDLLRYAKLAKDNVLTFGPTGPGKTSLVLAYGAKDKIPVATVQCNGAVDPNTFWGGWQPNTDNTESVQKFLDLYADVKAQAKGLMTEEAIVQVAIGMMDRNDLVWVDSEITLIIRYGGILYLDEVNFLPPKIAAVFHGLLDKRRQITIPERGNMVVKASPDLQVICAYNPDYEGTKPLNAAFKNRFKIKVRFDYDETVEKELVCIPVMLDVARKLRTAHKNGDLDTPCSTNMLVEFEELAVDLGYEFAMANFLNAYSDEERQSVGEAFDAFSEDIKRQVKEMEELAASSS